MMSLQNGHGSKLRIGPRGGRAGVSRKPRVDLYSLAIAILLLGGLAVFGGSVAFLMHARRSEEGNSMGTPRREQSSSTLRRPQHAEKDDVTSSLVSMAKNDASVVSRRKSGDGKVFPSPAALAGPDATVIIEPKLGTHHSDKDAVFAFAEGYPLDRYILFITSLRNTGFDGDIVLSVSTPDKLAPGVEEFLRLHSEKGVIAYMVDWECYKKSGVKFEKSGVSTTNNGFTDCKIHGLFGDATGNPVDDPRDARPVATARYELYWAWSLRYKPNSRILLIDFRDTYFQLNPFGFLPKSPADGSHGVLHVFEENRDAMTIGKSKQYNAMWIRSAYGQDVLDKVINNPIICSGSTMGDQVAVESYLRAMVKQYDDTKCKRVGCDQGLHNYLYYFDVLKGSSGIVEVILHKQGEGAVNNLAAMRERPLIEHGVLKEGSELVYNWDGSVSPVVHQFDRDQQLKEIIKLRCNELKSSLALSFVKGSTCSL